MTILRKVTAVHEVGIQPWPVQHDHTKAPRGSGWTNLDRKMLDLDATLAMFEEGDTGMGVLCGAISGNLELLEFEGRFVNSDGYNEFLSRCEDEGLGDVLRELQRGYEVVSPSGGIHLLFRTDGPARGNTKLARRPALAEELENNPAEKVKTLIETRGEGGFAILAGSNGKIHQNGGKWALQQGHPSTIATITTDEREMLYELASTFDEMVAPPSMTSGLGGNSTSELVDWVIEKIGVAKLLIEDGWKIDFAKRNGEELWVRPGKEVRDGHSASVFPDGGMNVYSTSISPAWERALMHDKAFPYATPVGILAAVRFEGDIAKAMSSIRREITGASAPALPVLPSNVDPVTGEILPGADHPRGEGSVDAERLAVDDLNLPDEFWESRPAFEQIRQAALSTLTVPDAVLGSVLARYAAMVPATVKLPPIVGSSATFDFITCIVAASSGGKSVSNGVAKRLLPGRSSEKWVMFDAPVGSGEGLVQAFMGYEKDEKGKNVGEPSYKFGKHKSIHFTVDEGTAIIEAQSRRGTTLVQTLCSAWSGSTLGSLNASIDTNRLVPGGKRRVAATINIQTAMAPMLFDSAIVGLPKRIAFFWAHGPQPESPPEWPGELEVIVPDGWDYVEGVEMEAASAIVAEIRRERRSVSSGELALGDLDGHIKLIQLKVAGLFALMEDRQTIEVEDWNLAEMVMNHSTGVREHAERVKIATDREAALAKTVAAANRESAIEDLKERQAIVRLRESIIRKVEQDPIAPNSLARAVTSSTTRHRFEEALQAALDDGAVEYSPDRTKLVAP